MNDRNLAFQVPIDAGEQNVASDGTYFSQLSPLARQPNLAAGNQREIA
ncbi:hypothetical protein [Sphingomonas faeni]